MKLPTDVPAAVGRPSVDLASEIAGAILRTVEAGWRLAMKSPDVSADDREVEITERLRDGMRSALNSGMFKWKGNMFVFPGTQSRSRPDVLVPDGLTDISIFLVGIGRRLEEHDPHAVIECKRITGKNADLCRKYVVEGIDRFRTGKYSGNHSIGFMAGYLISGDEKSAVNGVNRYLKGKSRSAESLRRSHLIAESWVRQSQHERMGKSPIELYHALLSFVTA